MIKSIRSIQQNRPVSRLQINIVYQTKTKVRIPSYLRSQSLGNPWRKLKAQNTSPTKQNERPRANLKREKQVKAAPAPKMELPVIKNRKKLSEESRNRKKNPQDFETYCSKGHAVFVDQRDAGVKLGHLNVRQEQRERKLSEQKNYLGETAYVPYNIEDLKKKVEQKLNMSTSTCFEQSN